ncbi:MAG: hypothetical protein ACFFDR_04560, partial [Candidatus Thorarchaeota archaeon]
ELHEAQEPQYFYLHMESVTRLRITINLPLEYEGIDFNPTLIIMGHDLGTNDTIPEYVELPSGLEAMVFESETSIPVYEGFTPSAFLVTLNLNLQVSDVDHYYLAVFDDSMGGRYSITLGYVEIFTLEEWLLVPFSVISIHLWEGQSLALILLPMLVIPVIGLILFQRGFLKIVKRDNPLVWIGLVSTLFILASGAVIFMQMILATASVGFDPQIVITFIFGLLPFTLGFFGARLLSKADDFLDRPNAIRLFAIGIISLFVWGGYIIGPLILSLISLLSLVKSFGTSK